MTDGNISAPVADDNHSMASDAQHLPFFIVHHLRPGLQLRQQVDYRRHITVEAARAEMWRLAKKYPGHRFAVLEAIDFVEIEPAAVAA